MADLYYFPLMAGDWLAGEAISMMTPEQEGAFVHLLCHAWQSTELPCSLPNDEKALAQLSRLGDRWSTEGLLVRAQFVTVGREKTRLRNPKLWNVFREFQDKHARRVASGRTGGIAKAKRKQSPSNATAMLEQSSSSHNHNHNQKKIEAGAATTDRFRARLLEADWASYDELLSRVPNPESWSAELDAMLDGMAGHVRATREQIGRGIRDMVANGKHKDPNIRQLRRYVQGAAEDKQTSFPEGTRDRAARLYEAFKRHGFTRNLPMETHFATVAALSAAGKIQDGEQFIAELKAVSPWTWMGSTREIDKEKTISRIATAIAPLQPPKAA